MENFCVCSHIDVPLPPELILFTETPQAASARRSEVALPIDLHYTRPKPGLSLRTYFPVRIFKVSLAEMVWVSVIGAPAAS